MLQTPSPTPSSPVAEEEEFYSSWSLFLVCMLLILSLWTSYWLQIRRIRAVHETLVAIVAGMFVGLIIRLAPGTMIREMLTFKHTLFFNLLLPPIILNSGYELKQENFFRNFGSILIFAFLGTFISAVGVGVLVYIYSFLGLEGLEVSLIECLIFGSTLSATDPVTILAIFNQYKVDPKLYTVIFGESLLNDAVSIVMYDVSMALGVTFGLAMSLLLKHSSLALYPGIESCLVALSAYTCYFFSNGISMSGIVSLLFCGITLKHYAYHTMSRRTQRTTKYIFSTLAQLTENFIFIYLGLSLFTSPPSSTKVTNYVKPLFITITTVAVVFTRYAAVFPLSEAINFFHRHVRGQRTEELPHSYQMMLFWAGLRGAVGVALAAGFKGENAQTLRITVLVVVVLTVVVFGGTTARMLEVLGIRTGVEDEGASDSDDEEYLARNPWMRRNGRWQDEETYMPPQSSTFGGRMSGRGQVGVHYEPRVQIPRSFNHQAQSPVSPLNNNTIFSAASSDSYESDGGEVLPMAVTSPMIDHHKAVAAAAREGRESGRSSPIVAGTSQEAQWFQALDERYLLPLFSNATASRTFHARKARRSLGHPRDPSQLGGGSGSRSPADTDDEGDGAELDLTQHAGRRTSSPEHAGMTFPPQNGSSEARMERGLASPMLRRDSEGANSRDRGS
ncbi:hypothetical protein EUX98_g7804 [Antrodiella citrinella]|uniref:Cation/H+ exchanger transmembrane domain-containing protein n=1 Tax=Antrodiella citrinella TaxID=2447956 RepID=A0A4S4MSR1_9APHY|nr:hypothetical protein EUX98_g7804 [Antrodiella citrinella]